MLNYSFLEIFETFTREDIKAFKRFISSPYFNRSKKVVRLFDQVIKYYPNFESHNLTKEKLHAKTSPQIPYNDITMRRLLFDLQNLTEKYLQQINFDSKKIDSRTFMTEEMGTRGTTRMFKKNVKATRKLMDEVGYLDSDMCLNRFRLETNQFYVGMIHGKINKKSFMKTEAAKLINGITYLISYFMLEAIKHNDTLLTYSRSFNIKNNEKIITQFLGVFDFDQLNTFMKENSLTGGYIIDVYLNALRSFLYFEDEQNYNRFRESLYEYKDRLNLTDNNFLFAKLSGYCTLKTANRPKIDDNFDYDKLSIYKTMLDEKYYETNSSKFIQVDLYRNILTQAIKLKELDWLDDFIFTYGQKLHPRSKTDIMNFGYAELYFERNAYDESLSLLSRIKTDEFLYNLDIRNLYFRIYCELEDYETAFSHLKAYQKFIKENQSLSESKRTAHSNFSKYSQKLLNNLNTNNKTDLSSLYLHVSNCKSIDKGDWLLNKIAALDKSALQAI